MVDNEGSRRATRSPGAILADIGGISAHQWLGIYFAH